LGAVRVGFVHGAVQIETIAHFLRRKAPDNSVFAPALRAGTEVLADAETQGAMARHLYPAARVVVARAAELPLLTGHDAEDLQGLREAAERLQAQGARAVVISGLFLRGRVIDFLADGSEVTLFDTARIQAPHVAGLSGSYPAALAAHIARGLSLRDAAESAQRYVGFRIQRGR
jgi:hydroxymethylpyrimidine/phosphomethylpyrimidine kinase